MSQVKSDSPLFLHRNGQYAKKIRGTTFYFGTDADSALELYQREKADLHAGRRPRRNVVELTLGTAMDRFLSIKKQAELNGEITPGTYTNYVKTCDQIAKSIGTKLAISDVRVEDLEKLRADLAVGPRGRYSIGTLRTRLNNARCLFNYANTLVDVPVKYLMPLKSPSKKLFRAQRGIRMFEREEITAAIKAADPQLRAMIYLGINCAFGPTDCALITPQYIRANGWHSYPRSKTGAERRFPLWPETIKAIKAWERVRPKSEYLFSDDGKCWARPDGTTEISRLFRILLVDLGMYEKNVKTFYSLRRTFSTIGASTGQQVAVDHAMGHLDQSMSAVYRQRTFDKPLLKVSEAVRNWLLGRVAAD